MANPLIRRELVSVLRQPRMLLLQLGMAIGFALLVILRWPTDARMSSSGSRSHEVFLVLSYGLLAALSAHAPRLRRRASSANGNRARSRSCSIRPSVRGASSWASCWRFWGWGDSCSR